MLEGHVQRLGDGTDVAPDRVVPAALDFGDAVGGEVSSLGEGSLGEPRLFA